MRALPFLLLPVVAVCVAASPLVRADGQPVSNWTAPLYWSPGAQRVAPAEPETGLVAHAEAAPAIPVPLPAPTYVFVAVTPCRIVDTRVANADGFHSPNFGDDESRTFPFPSSLDCPGLPATAGAYSLNIQFRPISQLSFLTAYPTGTALPGVSTMTAGPSAWVQNAAIVPAGTSGAIDVYCQFAGRVIIDVNGYYTRAGGTWLSGGTIAEDGFGGYMGIGVSTLTLTESAVSAASPMTGTIDSFMVSMTNSNCSLPRTFTVRVNGGDTTLTCSVSSGRTCSDLLHQVPVTAGDTISVFATFSSGCVADTWWRARLR